MNLWLLTDSMPWSAEILQAANTPELGGGIGGAEAMTIGLCRALAQHHGHTVTIWATKCEAPGQYGPVRWRAVERGLRFALVTEPSPDVFVSVRRPEAFSLPEMDVLRGRRVLWAQDILALEQGQVPHLANVDTIVYMSHWHRQQWASVHPPIGAVPSWVSAVAFDPAWIGPSTEHQRTTFIYASRPERGLIPLLQMWPRIRMALPGAVLLITGYTQGVMVEEADRLLADVPGVEVVRSADKVGFYRQLQRARLLLYPGTMDETNGHVAGAAVAAGVLPILTRRGALPETMPEPVAVYIDGDAMSVDYQDRFIAEVVRLSDARADAEVAARLRVGQAHVMAQCPYSVVADAWDRQLTRQTYVRSEQYAS